MRLVGYADELRVEPGGTIRFMVSAEVPRYCVEVVRLFHGDANPAGPGFKAEVVVPDLAGELPGRVQLLRRGSYVRVPTPTAFPLTGSFALQLRMWPTTPDRAEQTLLARTSADGRRGVALRLVDGRLELAIGAGRITVPEPVRAHRWYTVTATYDASSKAATLSTEPVHPTGSVPRLTVEGRLDDVVAIGAADLLIAAEAKVVGGKELVTNFYNGKIDGVTLHRRADGARAGLLASWDFSLDIPTRVVTDTSGHGHHGRTVNMPTRGMTGWRWDGSETAWPHALDQYGAIHFHEDDLDDAGWEPSFEWKVPEDTPSGVYAAHLTAGEDEDFVWFAVRPKRGRPTARIAFLMPTFSYLAYANQHLLEGNLMRGIGSTGRAASAYPSTPQDRFILANRLHSLYDTHADGSGVSYASRRRPLVNQRPKYHSPTLNDGDGTPHQFNADLCLLDWLHEQGYDVDVVTDEDLHLEGEGVLAPYRVVLTGSHHEYWSGPMIDGAQTYLRNGGRMMYLAGNGMYWVTQHDPELGTGIECRRPGPSTRTWDAEPGEAHLAATGELGGIWRHRGRSPQSWLGVGFTAQGLGPGRPYERRPGSQDPRAAWVFDGVGSDELIGDFPSLVNSWGAAGFEIDRHDPALGGEHAVVLASATGFSDSFQHAVEELLLSTSLQGGTVEPRVRADMTLMAYPNGGAVFSTGSISWIGCLSYAGYENNVSRVTRNVLDRFLSDADPMGPADDS
jgi:N,N-dimethylformamidase